MKDFDTCTMLGFRIVMSLHFVFTMPIRRWLFLFFIGEGCV